MEPLAAHATQRRTAEVSRMIITSSRYVADVRAESEGHTHGQKEQHETHRLQAKGERARKTAEAFALRPEFFPQQATPSLATSAGRAFPNAPPLRGPELHVRASGESTL